jgi:hypothetical protein
MRKTKTTRIWRRFHSFVDWQIDWIIFGTTYIRFRVYIDDESDVRHFLYITSYHNLMQHKVIINCYGYSILCFESERKVYLREFHGCAVK